MLGSQHIIKHLCACLPEKCNTLSDEYAGYVFRYKHNSEVSGEVVNSGANVNIKCPIGEEFNPPEQQTTIRCDKGVFIGLNSICEHSMYIDVYSLLICLCNIYLGVMVN